MVAKYDDRTKRLDMPLPNADNFLQDDVARLIETINDLDGQVATLDAGGKLEKAQIPDVVPQLDASNKLADSVMPARAVMLDSTGKIPVGQLPNEGTTTTLNASTEQQMLGLNATVGDICDRLDNGIYYILVDLPASTLGNWRMLPRTAVTSINGETGAVTGFIKAKPVANAVATALEGVQGPLRLSAEGTDPYDAVTYKQLQTVQAVASGGASMNGVMNNFIGAVEWFNGDRINIPPGYVAADGDEYQRNDPKVADLWTAVNAGILNSVTQAEWDAKTSNTRGSFYYNRGSYSLGDNAKTFRVPDLNGSASGDAGSVIANAYLGGSSKVLQANVGQMRESMAPAISGEFVLRAAGTAASPWNISVSQTGAFEGGGAAPFGNATMLAAGPNNPAMNGYSVKINASRSSKVYTGSAGEIRPNTAVGIWIIRANGNFTASGTNFRVMTSDKVLPTTTGTQLMGGEIFSSYYAGGKELNRGFMRADKVVGGTSYLRLGVLKNGATDADAGPYNSIDILDTGAILTRAGATIGGDLFVGTGKAPANDLPTFGTVKTQAVDTHSVNLRETNKDFGIAVNSVWTDASSTAKQLRWEVYFRETAATARRSNIITVDCQDLTKGTNAGGGGNNTTAAMAIGCRLSVAGSVTGVGAYVSTSDARVKTNIKPVSNALKSVLSWGGCTYDKKDAGREVGLIAQDVEKTCPEAVTTARHQFNDGMVLEDAKFLNVAGVSAAYHTEAIRELTKLVKLAITDPQAALAQLAELKIV